MTEHLKEVYGRYIARCNEHRFDDLGEFVAEDVNAPDENLVGYVSGLKDVVASFPDYRWAVQEIIATDDRLAVRLAASGTHTGSPFRGVPATGQHIETMELAVYHVQEGKIVRCWGDLGTTVRDRLISGPN